MQAPEKLLEKRIRRMVTQAKLYDSGGERVRRHKVPLMNGFRRFFNKVGKEAPSHDSPLAALRKKEYMMGHQGTTPLDQNYKTDVLELAAEYVNIVPDLTIDDSERLKQSNKRMADNIQRMEDEKDAKIERLEGRYGTWGRRCPRSVTGDVEADKLLPELNDARPPGRRISSR